MLSFIVYLIQVILAIYLVQGVFKSDFWQIGLSILALIAPVTTIIISLIAMFVGSL